MADDAGKEPGRKKRKKARRGAGEGSVHQHKDGWRASYHVKRGGQVLRGSKVFRPPATKKDAQDWLAEQIGAPAAAGTVADWLAEWLKVTEPDVEATTFSDNSYRVNRFLVPRLGDVRLRDLDATAVVRMLADMHAEGRSDSERQKVGAVLRNALNAAVRLGRLSVSPMRHVKLPTPKRPEKRVMTPDELRAFVAAADARGCGHAFRLWADAGLRPQEMFVLEWADLDLAAGTVGVTKALDPDGRVVKEPKTRRGRRVLDLAPSTVAALLAVPAELRRGLLLHDRAGGVWWESNFRKAVLKPVGAAAGVPWVYAYCFRHTMAAILLSAGVNVLIISRRLGHEDITTTLRSYGHLLPDDQRQATAVMEGVLGGQRAPDSAPPV